MTLITRYKRLPYLADPVVLHVVSDDSIDAARANWIKSDASRYLFGEDSADLAESVRFAIMIASLRHSRNSRVQVA